MAVLTQQQVVSAPASEVRNLLMDPSRIPDFTQVRSVAASAPRLAVGVTWRNRGATLKLPSWDSSKVTEVSEDLIRWHTRSMVLGVIPVGADWSYTLAPADGGTRVTNAFERVTMFGLPVGPLIKAPFLPMLYLARGAMLAGRKRLAAVLSPSTATAV